MRTISPTRCLNAAIILMALGLSSCGGGTTTAGTGGSGIGGTGITRVSGNVAEVVGLAPHFEQGSARRSSLASIARWVSRPATAQTDSFADIRVSGGGKSTTTDFRGDFELVGVASSSNFTLTFEPPDSEPIVLTIGAVSQGAEARVRDVVLDTQRGEAQAASIEIRDNTDGGSCEPGNQGQGDPGSQGQGNPCPPGPDGASQANPGQGNQGQSQGNQGQGNQGQGNQGQGNQGQGNQGQGNPGQGN